MSLLCPSFLGPVCDVAGGLTPVRGVFGYVLTTITGWFTDAASWLLSQLGTVIVATTTPDLGAHWYWVHYRTMLGIAAAVALPMLCIAVVQAVIRQDPGILARVLLVQLPLAAVLAGAALTAVELSLSVTDVLSSAVATGTGSQLQAALDGVGSSLAVAAGGAPGLVVGLAAAIVVAGALTLWIELLVRSAAIYVATLFLPLALAGLVWPAVSHWSRRLVETLAALVLSKFVIVTVLSLAVGALGASGAGTGGMATVLTGAAMLLLAAFTPFTLLRLVPLVEVGAALSLEGSHRRVANAWGSLPYSAARRALAFAQDAGLEAGQAGLGSLGAAALGAGGAGDEADGPADPSGWGDFGKDYCVDPADISDDDDPDEPRYVWNDGTDGRPRGPIRMGSAAGDRAIEEMLRRHATPQREAIGGWGTGWINALWGWNFRDPGAADDGDDEEPTTGGRDLSDPDLPPEWGD